MTSDIKRSTSFEEASTPTLQVHRIYIKSSTFEAAFLTDALLQEASHATIDFQAQVNHHSYDDNKSEAVLELQLTSKLKGNRLWQLNLQQAGLYTLTGYSEAQRNALLNGVCINQLYPYACAAAHHLVVNGGFPPVLLAPMDFVRIYREQQQHSTPSVEATVTESIQ